MFDPKAKIWLDGTITTLADSGISPLTHSLHYGSGAFEGIRAYQSTSGQTNIFRLTEHIDRLFYSAETIFLTIPYTKEELIGACVEVIRANDLSEAYIRPLVFHDESSLGISVAHNKPRVLIAAWPWGQYLSDAVSVAVASHRRISEKSLVSDAKVSGHYVNSLLATTEAKQAGYQEALLLDHNENIAEGPGENIFFIKNTELHTPKLGKILNGITRNAVISFASDLDFSVTERDITLSELSNFDAAFFTGTAAEISPIASIDQGSTSRAEFSVNLVEPIKSHYQKIIRGEDEAYAKWLHPVKK